MADLYDIMTSENFRDSENDYDDKFSSMDMGMALGFGDFLASEREDLSDIIDEDLILDYEISEERIDYRSRKVPVPAFEQYVQKICGIK